jgi:hypothetical protein
MFGIPKSVTDQGVSYVAAGFGRVVTRCVPGYRHVSKCRLYLGTSNAQFLSVLEDCALHRDPDIIAFFERISEECMNLQDLALQLLRQCFVRRATESNCSNDSDIQPLWLRLHIDKVFPLMEAVEAQRRLENRESTGKIILQTAG